jgi:hypothetical protein
MIDFFKVCEQKTIARDNKVTPDAIPRIGRSRSREAPDLSPDFHPGMDRVLTRFEPGWLGGATARGAEPPV